MNSGPRQIQTPSPRARRCADRCGSRLLFTRQISLPGSPGAAVRAPSPQYRGRLWPLRKTLQSQSLSTELVMKARLPSRLTELAMKTSHARLPRAQAPAHHAAPAPDEHVASAPARFKLKRGCRNLRCALRVARLIMSPTAHPTIVCNQSTRSTARQERCLKHWVNCKTRKLFVRVGGKHVPARTCGSGARY